MSDTVGVEEDVYARFKAYCEQNGIREKFAASRAIEDYLDEETDSNE